MDTLIRIILGTTLFMLSFQSLAQPPGGGRRAGSGPEEMIAREKQALFTKVEDLSDDQKLLLEGIYNEFEVTLKETFEEMRQTPDREKRREKMQALSREKDDLIKDVLNDGQYKVYESISASRRSRREEPKPDDPS